MTPSVRCQLRAGQHQPGSCCQQVNSVPDWLSSRADMDQTHKTYTEIGIHLHHLTLALRIPEIKLRRPKFWRRKQKISSSSSSSTSSSSSLTPSSSSSDDWIKDFHARYNPLNTSTPLRAIPDMRPSPVMNCSGVKIYEDYDDLEDTRTRDEYYDLVTVEHHKVIARLMFGDNYRRNNM